MLEQDGWSVAGRETMSFDARWSSLTSDERACARSSSTRARTPVRGGPKT